MQISMLFTLILSTIVFKSQAQPQGRVECDGVHALCTAALCNLDGECECEVLDSVHQIAIARIRNEALKDETAAACTIQSPCGRNEAPVCAAINNGTYYDEQNDILSEVTSTYSWETFCQRTFVQCDDSRPWASCMAAPCVRNNDDPPKVGDLGGELVTCICDVRDGEWNDGTRTPEIACNGYPDDVIRAGTPIGFVIANNIGADYVQDACVVIEEDLPEGCRSGDGDDSSDSSDSSSEEDEAVNAPVKNDGKYYTIFGYKYDFSLLEVILIASNILIVNICVCVMIYSPCCANKRKGGYIKAPTNDDCEELGQELKDLDK